MKMFNSLKKKINEQKEKRKEKKAEKVLKEIDKINVEKDKLKEEKKELNKLKEEKKQLEEETETKEEPIETETEKKPMGLNKKIDNITEQLDIITKKGKTEKKLKKKRFKIPFAVKSQLKKLAVKDKVQVMLLQRTRNIKPVIGELRDGMLLVKGQIYNGAVNSTWLWDGKYPTHLVPEWDLQPLTPEGIDEIKKTAALSPDELYKDCLTNKRSAEPQKIILRAIEAKQNQMLTGKVSVKAVILTIVGTLVVAAVLFGGGVM